jgi:hypothetical protein
MPCTHFHRRFIALAGEFHLPSVTPIVAFVVVVVVNFVPVPVPRLVASRELSAGTSADGRRRLRSCPTPARTVATHEPASFNCVPELKSNHVFSVPNASKLSRCFRGAECQRLGAPFHSRRNKLCPAFNRSTHAFHFGQHRLAHRGPKYQPTKQAAAQQKPRARRRRFRSAQPPR